jgi:hypothetical protein
LNGNFRDAESAINRSGKSLDWQERIFGFELKETEGDFTHGLVVMLKGDTEEELDDAVVSVYFKKRVLASMENAIDDARDNIDLARDLVNPELRDYRDEWLDQDCGNFPVGPFPLPTLPSTYAPATSQDMLAAASKGSNS